MRKVVRPRCTKRSSRDATPSSTEPGGRSPAKDFVRLPGDGPLATCTFTLRG